MSGDGCWSHRVGCRCPWCVRIVLGVDRCAARRKGDGEPCRALVAEDSKYCGVHQDPRMRGSEDEETRAERIEREIVEARARLDPGPLYEE